MTKKWIWDLFIGIICVALCPLSNLITIPFCILSFLHMNSSSNDNKDVVESHEDDALFEYTHMSMALGESSYLGSSDDCCADQPIDESTTINPFIDDESTMFEPLVLNWVESKLPEINNGSGTISLSSIVMNQNMSSQLNRYSWRFVVDDNGSLVLQYKDVNMKEYKKSISFGPETTYGYDKKNNNCDSDDAYVEHSFNEVTDSPQSFKSKSWWTRSDSM